MKEDKQTPQTEKYFEDQMDDEEVLYVFRKHPVVMRKGLIFGMLGLVAGTIPALIRPEYSYFFGGLAAGLVLGLILFFPSWINWYYSIFIVTDHRLIQITQKGLFHKSVVDLNLQQIKSLNYEIAGIQQTVLGFGTILIQTYIGDLVIHNVPHPPKITKRLGEILRDHGNEKGAQPYDKDNTEVKEDE